VKTAIALFLVLTFSQAIAENNVQKSVIENKGKIRTIISTFPDKNFDKKYLYFNPFVQHDNTIISDEMTAEGNLIYSTVYHTGLYGFRKTMTNEEASTHIMLAGDSNMFGVGVQDNETLASRLSQNLPQKKIVNLGLGGTGPSSFLYFLQNFSLKPITGKATKGMLILDFHHHLIDRVIGSKLFLSWFKNSPRYDLDNGKVVFAGSFEDYLPAKFYLFLNKLPWNNVLFPNLPRINHSHIVLTAKVIAQIKNEYLRQTDKGNRFIVTFNPAYVADSYRQQQNLEDLQKALTDEKIEFITFNAKEIKTLPIIKGEYHQSAVAHQNYAQMLIEKLKLSNK